MAAWVLFYLLPLPHCPTVVCSHSEVSFLCVQCPLIPVTGPVLLESKVQLGVMWHWWVGGGIISLSQTADSARTCLISRFSSVLCLYAMLRTWPAHSASMKEVVWSPASAQMSVA